VGFFGRFVYSDGAWRDAPKGDSYLAIDIHDSDIAAIQYAPATGTGIFFLGAEPRDYFDDPEAHDPVDMEREAGAFVAWAAEVAAAHVEAADVLSLMARPDADEPRHLFVEEAVVALLHRLDLPLPHELEPERTE
jgi:hypothetical protein